MLLLELLLQISPDGIAARDEKTFRFARSRNIPIVMLTSGPITSKKFWHSGPLDFMFLCEFMHACPHACMQECICATVLQILRETALFC